MSKNSAGADGFEEGLAELETIVKKMESGEVKLAELVSFYERGVKLKAHLEGALKDAKLKIERAEGGRLSEFKTEQDKQGAKA